MTVYVDDMRAPYRGMIMCHMMADTTEELLAMADRIGVSRRWIQHAGTPHEHLDISRSCGRAAPWPGPRRPRLEGAVQGGRVPHVRRADH
ncbi:MAG: DUF4031 domain-containing protein [Mesorhizobium amorphae]|nr:MAG: DUF4031 domain-containing protein [Mesorhizobium amorphae]